MSAVLLDVLGPPVSGNWIVPLSYSGFKHIGLQGNARYTVNKAFLEFIFYGTGVSPLIRDVGATKQSSLTGTSVTREVVPRFTCGGSAEGSFLTFFDLTIFDFGTSDNFSSASFTATSPNVDTGVEIEMVSGLVQLLSADAITRVELTPYGETFDTDSEIKVFGYRG
jgi:hypothetical protein